MPLKDRLWFRLIALFLMSFMALFMLLFVWDLFVSIGESAALESNPAAQAPPVTIDPKIETELQKVLAFDTVSDSVVTISDPFVDRSGLTNAVSTAGTAQRASAGTTSGTTGTATTASVNSSSGSGTRTVSGTANTAENLVIPTSKDRYQIWEEKVKMGYDAGPVSTAFSVDDLIPVGYVSGGSGAEEVMFFSTSLCRTFSFPVGARFFDGWLGSLSQQEVVFSLDDNSRIVRKSFTTPQPCNGSAGAVQ